MAQMIRQQSYRNWNQNRAASVSCYDIPRVRRSYKYDADFLNVHLLCYHTSLLVAVNIHTHITAAMQIKLLALAFVALAAANPLVARAPICPSGQTPSCCQLDVDGIVDLPCESGTLAYCGSLFYSRTIADQPITPVPGSPKSKKGLSKACAKTG